MAEITIRPRFEAELRSLEARVGDMAVAARTALELALQALAENEVELCAVVIDGDDEIDEEYRDVERSVLQLLALQTPVASDLRLVVAILHVNQHLERIADMAVNIAKLVRAAAPLPRSARVARLLQQMGERALTMLDESMRAFRERDTQLSETLPVMDEPVDELHQRVFREIVATAGDPERLEWGVRMHQVSRHLERVADHAVDIAEQVWFVVAGEMHDFSDERAVLHLE